ncbi:hypothetical protein DCAR_0833217 [Daucus carota subsp. sativus]|uniref:Uncharacterized protein n=1 Tax=Daucus carota subsp. sativus TaxID=79200 RepID=A0AAF0XST8_DAUCS|nr:hypothetical protein DCAR_0833217 [Daucus carota subsp. sativus]
MFVFVISQNLAAILQQYNDLSEIDEREATIIHEPENSKYASSESKGDLLQRVERDLAEDNLDHLTMENLAQLETEIETTLVQTRYLHPERFSTHLLLNHPKILNMLPRVREMDKKKVLESEKLLREENELLVQQVDMQ